MTANPHHYLVHDRDTVFSSEVDEAVNGFGLKVLKTLVRSPMANAFCERVIGTIRRECLDYVIPLNARHLRRIVSEFVNHYNRGRPHTALGPGFPEPIQATVPVSGRRHQLPPGYRVAKTPVLGGLHHEYRLQEDGLTQIIPQDTSAGCTISATAFVRSSLKPVSPSPRC
jgi:putative transposase